ncbi:MAG: hypothetical protein IJX11_03595 [Bacteroidales bacterium]|nr:hypothetical protein [Bacteroidales bacterium]
MVKTEFTRSEAEAIRRLIEKRTVAERSEQKKIRDKMRRLGFYGSHWGIYDCQVADFDNLISSGEIKIID